MILEKEPNDELRQNFISDKMQLHTSTHSELNLIKSVIYIYIYNLFIFYILNKIFLTFIKFIRNAFILVDFINDNIKLKLLS